MKRQLFIMFNQGRKAYQDILELLEPIGCTQGLAGLDHILCGLYQETFDADDPRLENLRSALTRAGIKWSEREEFVYSVRELFEYPLLRLGVNPDLEAGGPKYGTTYDLSEACARCGTGAIQTSPLQLPLKGFPKSKPACSAAHLEILVAEPLRNALETADVTGLELRQVQFYRNQEPLPWWQMISSYELPKMSPETKGIKTDEIDHVMDDGMVIKALPPCPVCRRDGRYNSDEPLQIVYARKDVDSESIPDVVHTWERFGVSVINEKEPHYSRFAPPILLIKPKVYEVFRSLKVKNAGVVPVRIS